MFSISEFIFHYPSWEHITAPFHFHLVRYVRLLMVWCCFLMCLWLGASFAVILWHFCLILNPPVMSSCSLPMSASLQFLTSVNEILHLLLTYIWSIWWRKLPLSDVQVYLCISLRGKMDSPLTSWNVWHNSIRVALRCCF